MGCASSSSAEGALPNEAELARNAEKLINKREEKSVKILLLGAGSSGKTTFRKQLRSIYVGFTETQRKEMGSVVVDNLVTGAKSIIEAAEILSNKRGEINTPGTKLYDAAQMIRALQENRGEFYVTEPQAVALRLLWSSEEIQNAVRNRNKFQIQECTLSFMRELSEEYPKWGGSQWIPSEDDCVRARIRTTGVTEEAFNIDGALFRVFDAGGQRSERRKWIHYFDRVDAVLFMTSLTAYAESLFEDDTQNSLEESITLFDEIANSPHFRSCPFMLFFNKRDMFTDLYTNLRVPLNVSGKFPDAPPLESTREDDAIKWMISLFMKRKRKNPEAPNLPADVNLYVHITTATSRGSVQKVFDICKTIILKRSLETTGFAM